MLREVLVVGMLEHGFNPIADANIRPLRVDELQPNGCPAAKHTRDDAAIGPS